MSNVSVDKAVLSTIYDDLKSALFKLEAIVAEVGCLHLHSQDVTTMDGSGKRRTFCFDCGETIEEEINYEEESGKHLGA